MVRLAGTIHRYVGFSWETKPYVGQRRLEDDYVLTAADLPIGSTFRAEDNGAQFVYNGETWKPDLETIQANRIIAVLNQGFASMLEESRKQRALLQMIVEDFPEEEGE